MEKFGPYGKLYVGTLHGEIAKLTLNEDFTIVTSQVISTVVPNRAIMGLAFDPLDTGISNPPLYCTSNVFFHGETKCTSGLAINGKVDNVSGANLDLVVDIFTGLPVSDHDHGTFSTAPFAGFLVVVLPSC